MWYLEPDKSQKSFYKKAMVEYDEGRYYLYSYGTCVCSCSVYGQDFKRYWADWSATTARHINAFRTHYAKLPHINKRDWVDLPVI